MRRIVIVLVMLMLAPGVAHAGGGGVDTSGCAGYSEGSGISMQDSCFSGSAHFAPSDTTITVTNNGFMPHSMTAVDGSFDTGLLDAGESFDLTVAEPGIYKVFCTLHGTAAGEGMAGVVVVGEAVPASMSAPLDMTPVEQALVAQTEPIWRAMDNQGRTMGEIRSVQSDIEEALDDIALSSSTDTAPETGTPMVVILVLVGLAAGVALASLLAVLRLRNTPAHVDGLPVASESSVG